MTTRRCRICGWPIFGERCPFCEAWTDRMAALAAMENAEAVARDDDQAWADYRDEQDNRRAVLQGVA